jgi:hypothetical protein
VFDTEPNSFNVHQAALTIDYQPKEGFGGLVNLTAGRDARVIASAGETTSNFDVTQAFVQYAHGPLTIIGGKFVTLAGAEVINSTLDTNYSRSILFGYAIPFAHTGVRLTYAASDQINIIAGVNNGWDQLTDANKGKTAELGATLNPIKPLSITVSGYSGQEVTSLAPFTTGTRSSLNAVASYTIIDPLSVGLEVLSVSQENAGGGTTKAKYNGAALYVTYMFTPKLRGVLRAESFDDKNGFHFAPGAPLGPFATSDTKYKEVTATVSFLANDSFEARAEVRRDQANNPVFFDFSNTPVASKTMTSIALQGLYKF